jgi:RNA polymerase sigma factor (TIGR02999 family)
MMTDVTRILNAIEQGDERAADNLLPLVYDELRLLAAKKLSEELPGQTLQATALVHEVYIKLVGEDAQNWKSKSHFFRTAAEAMRRILVNNARRKKSLKHGGNHQRINLVQAVLSYGNNKSIDEALKRLENKDKVKADLVKLRYFAGLTGEQSAKALGISHATAERYWDYARSWLRVAILTSNGTTHR